MIPPDELVDAPDYKWRRWWAKAGIPLTAAVFTAVWMIANLFVAIGVAAVFYFAVGRKMVELDARARGFESPNLDDIIASALKRKQDHARDEAEQTASGIPRVAEPDAGPRLDPRRPVAKFGKAAVPGKKPVDLPRHRS
jgi:hypothetical protein